MFALLGYSYYYGFGKFAGMRSGNKEEEERERAKRDDALREKERFERRMREVEESYREEVEAGERMKVQSQAQVQTPSQPPSSSGSKSWYSKLWGKKD